MPFAGYLNNNDLQTLVQAAIDGDLLEVSRTLHLQGIARPYILALTTLPNALDQLQLDLNAINRVERLANGDVPLVQFLTNASFQLRLRGRKEAEVFERYANMIGNRTRGVSNLPEPSQLPEIVRNEAIIGQDDMVDFAFLQRGACAGRSVARILVPRFENGQPVATARGMPWIMIGTAWLVAPTLAVTNHHVINARTEGEAADPTDFERQAQESIFEFDFDSSDAVKVTVKAMKIESASKELDYAVLRLARSLDRKVLRLAPQRVEVNATTYMAVNIIQHPQGKPKRAALRNNLVTAADADVIRYFTDTDFGSSGSPVCDDNWRVVALHRGAKYVQGVKFNGKDTAYVNFGSQVQAVIEDLSNQVPSIGQEVAQAQLN